MKITGYLLSSLLLVCLLSACGSVKDVAYLQGGGLFDKMAVVDTFEMKIVKMIFWISLSVVQILSYYNLLHFCRGIQEVIITMEVREVIPGDIWWK